MVVDLTGKVSSYYFTIKKRLRNYTVKTTGLYSGDVSRYRSIHHDQLLGFVHGFDCWMG